MFINCHNCKNDFEITQKRFNNCKRRNQSRFFCGHSCLHSWQSEYFRKAKEPLIQKIKKLLPDGKRKCSKCQEIKDITEFGKRDAKRLQAYCKPCFYLFQMLRWNMNKVKAIAYLGGRCLRCGFSGHPALFDFHHVNPKDKEFEWYKLRLRSWNKICKELDKCELLCARCHREIELNPDLWTFLPRDQKLSKNYYSFYQDQLKT